MALWSVKPEWKKSIIERNYITKDGNTLMVETGWRWGEFTVETEDDNPPDIEAGVDIYNCGYNGELVETNDGCWEEYDYDDCDDETREWLEEFFDEGNSWMDLEEEGWVQDECEMIIDCDLIIERLDDDGNPTGEIVKADNTDEEEVAEPIKLNTQAKWPFDTGVKPSEFLKFKCVACDFTTDDIMDLVEITDDDSGDAFFCPKCDGKVETE